MRTVALAEVPPQPWRNGGGSTRELWAGPQGTEWHWRVSIATIDADGRFSAFAGIERHFAVLQGAGVQLHLNGRDHRCTADRDALRFDGDAAPMCRLIDGATLDLNLMVRRSAGSGVLQRATTGQPWISHAPRRALWCGSDAHLQIDSGEMLAIRAGSLVLGDDSTDSATAAGQRWQLDLGDEPAPAWWIGYSPHAR